MWLMQEMEGQGGRYNTEVEERRGENRISISCMRARRIAGSYQGGRISTMWGYVQEPVMGG